MAHPCTLDCPASTFSGLVLYGKVSWTFWERKWPEQRCKVTNCSGLPKTKEFPGMQEFQCSNQASPKQTRTTGHPSSTSEEQQWFYTAGACRVSNEAGEAAEVDLRGLCGPLNPGQKEPLKSFRRALVSWGCRNIVPRPWWL